MISLLAAGLLEKLLEPILLVVGTTVAGIVGTILSAILIKMKRKLNLEVEEKEQEQTEKAIKEAILQVNQTFVDELKKKTKDGHLSKDEAKEALTKTVSEAKKKLTKLTGLRNAFAAELLKDEGELVSKIEATLPKVKTETAIKVPKLEDLE